MKYLNLLNKIEISKNVDLQIKHEVIQMFTRCQIIKIKKKIVFMEYFSLFINLLKIII